MKPVGSPFSYTLFILASILMVAPLASWAQQGGGYYGGHMWDGGWHGWLFGPMMMILFVALVVMAVVIVVRWLGDGNRESAPRRSSDKSPIEILEERFARGEIDKEEFEERRRVLQ